MISLHSLVYWLVGTYGGGWVMSTGISFSRLPLMLHMMRNRLGSSVSTGQTLMAMGLYFLLVYMASGVHAVGKLIVHAGVSKAIIQISEGKML